MVDNIVLLGSIQVPHPDIATGGGVDVTRDGVSGHPLDTTSTEVGHARKAMRGLVEPWTRRVSGPDPGPKAIALCHIPKVWRVIERPS